MVNMPIGVSRPLLPLDIAEAAMGTPPRYSTTRCLVRSITRNTGPVEEASGSQTNWSGLSRAALSIIDSFWCVTGCAAAEAATHARNPNSSSRFTNYLVQAICSRTGPRLRAALYRGRNAAAIRKVTDGDLGEDGGLPATSL